MSIQPSQTYHAFRGVTDWSVFGGQWQDELLRYTLYAAAQMQIVAGTNDVRMLNRRTLSSIRTMPKMNQVSHAITKHPLVNPVVTWFQHRGIQANDIFVASYPRSGSTWLRFMLYELLTGNESSFTDVDRVVAGVGSHPTVPPIFDDGGRLLQTHEPYRKGYCSAIFLVRDVRDVVVSEFNFLRYLGLFDGEFDLFFEGFMRGSINRYGFWGDHTASWCRAISQDVHIVLIKFEDLRQDPCGSLKRILQHLQVERDEERIEQVVQRHTLQRMKAKEDGSVKLRRSATQLRFVTDGAVGKGRDLLSTAQMNRLQSAVAPLLEQLDYPVTL